MLFCVLACCVPPSCDLLICVVYCGLVFCVGLGCVLGVPRGNRAVAVYRTPAADVGLVWARLSMVRKPFQENPLTPTHTTLAASILSRLRFACFALPSHAHVISSCLCSLVVPSLASLSSGSRRRFRPSISRAFPCPRRRRSTVLHKKGGLSGSFMRPRHGTWLPSLKTQQNGGGYMKMRQTTLALGG